MIEYLRMLEYLPKVTQIFIDFFFKFQVDWRSTQPIDSNLDVVDTPTLDLPEGSLQGGNSYNISVTVLVEKENKQVQKSVASVTLDVEVKGLLAVVTPSEITASQKRKTKLSGILSQDLDNSNQQMQVKLGSTYS